MLTNFAKRSKKYLPALITAIVLSLASCSPTKKSVQIETHNSGRAETETVLTQRVHQDSAGDAQVSERILQYLLRKMERERSSNEEVTTVTREYDTSITDSAGQAPLKKEITETRRKATTAKSTESTAESADTSRAAAVKTKSDKQTNTDIKSTGNSQTDINTQVLEEQKKGLSPVQQFLFSLGLLLIVGIIIWLLCKVIKWYLTNKFN